MRQTLTLILAFLLFQISCTAIYAQPPIAVYIFEYKPFVYFEKNDAPTGIIIDIGNEFSRITDIKIKYEHIPTNRYQKLVKTGDINIMFNSKQLVSEDIYLIAKEPTLALELHLFRQKHSPVIEDINNLAEQRLVMMSQYRYGGLPLKLQSSNTLFRVKNYVSALNMLQHKRADYLLAYGKLLEAALPQQALLNLESNILTKNELYLCVNKKLKNATKIFSTLVDANSKLKNSGFIKRTIQRYANKHQNAAIE